MKEFIVMSGKGGTGKTSITAALGALAGKEAVMADCDVDAANLHILYRPQDMEKNEFFSGKTAVIDYDICTDCGICQQKCRFDAIDFLNGKYIINETACEGCAVCHYLCPEKAIEMCDNMAGHWFYSMSRFENYFIHAKLGIGQDNSGKLVSKVKEEAKKLAAQKNIPFVIVDGPPGVGCPVISSFSGISHVLIVTEASKSGFHDLKRLVELIEFFKAKASCVINKYDLNPDVADEIESYCMEHHIKVITKISFNAVFRETLREGKTLLEADDQSIKDKIKLIWNELKNTE